MSPFKSYPTRTLRRLGFALVAGGVAAMVTIIVSACGGGSDDGSTTTTADPTVAQNGSELEGTVTVYASPT